MELAGWTLLELAPLFAGFAGLTTLFYLLKMRRRTVVVPFAALWEQVLRESDSRRVWNRLRRWASWLLQLLLIAWICLALGDPRPSAWMREPVTTAIIIDGSASMRGPSASQDISSTRLDQARALARQRIGQMHAVDRALILVAENEARIVASQTDDPQLLTRRLEAIEPGYGEANFERALTIARHALSTAAHPRILVITDGAVESNSLAALQQCSQDDTIPCQLELVSGPVDNVAIKTFAVRRYPNDHDRVQALVQVHNYGDEPASCRLVVTADDAPIGNRRLTLQPGETRLEPLSDLDAARSVLFARIEAENDTPSALGPAFDDVAVAVVPPLEPLDVTLVSDGTDLFLEAALLTLGEHIRLQGVSATNAQEHPRQPALREADLVIFDVADQPLPATLPPTHIAIFDPWRRPDSSAPIAKHRDVGRPFLTEQDRDHPLLDNVVLKDVNIARGTTLTTEPGDAVLVRTVGDPIVVLRERDHLLLAVGFDPRQSDMVLRVAFPIFVDNLVRYVGHQRHGFLASLRLGRHRAVLLSDLGLESDGVSRVEVLSPGGEAFELPVERGEIRLSATTPGIYRITALDGETPGVTANVAAHAGGDQASDLHPRTSDFAPATPTSDGVPTPPVRPLVGLSEPVWLLLILLVAIAVAIEWMTYHRRLTV